MTTENDRAWARYLEAKNIIFDQPAYPIEAAELKALAMREPRLLAKFDTPEQLAQPLKQAGYTVIPTRNGQYQLVRGNLFIALPRCGLTDIFAPKLSFPLVTAGRGSGEAQYIDYAFNTGLLAHFLDLDVMYQTIRGREYTGRFEFVLSELEFQVESVQIEVDAGYESIYDVILVEAKIGVPEYFNVRQMYYPYRHFDELALQKRVRNVFLAYDLPSASYHLYEYIFREQRDPLSADMEKCAVYRLVPPAHLTIHDLIDARFQTHNQLVPQADNLNKVFELLTAVDAGINNAEDVADYFVFDKRQSSYYREAAEYLGLITSSHGEGYELTNLGIQVLSEPADTQARILAKVVVNSWIFVKLIRHAGANGKFTDADIDTIIASVQGADGTAHYSGTTVPRRRRTIVAWIKWLAQEMGCFEVSIDGYRLI
jgi:hypothetical protein